MHHQFHQKDCPHHGLGPVDEKLNTYPLCFKRWIQKNDLYIDNKNRKRNL